jgi:hypothetical protein
VKLAKFSQVEDGDDGTAGEQKSVERLLCVSAVFQYNDRDIALVLISAIKKMALARQVPLKHPLGQPVSAVLRLATETGFRWATADYSRGLDFGSFVSTTTKNFFFWEELGHGAHGRVFLVSGGAKGNVGVVKFFHKKHTKNAAAELAWWKKVYGSDNTIPNPRMVRLMGKAALLMPWFQSPDRNESTLLAVQTALQQYHRSGVVHQDVAWRNVGVYDEGQKAVVFDMGQVRALQEKEDDAWIARALTKLLSKFELKVNTCPEPLLPLLFAGAVSTATIAKTRLATPFSSVADIEKRMGTSLHEGLQLSFGIASELEDTLEALALEHESEAKTQTSNC